MGQIGDGISTAVPSVNAVGTQYATDINAILDEVIARLTVKVPIGSIRAGQVGESLDMNSTPILNAQYVQLYTGSSSGAPYNRLAQVGGDLYWVNSAGGVRITSGSTLDASSLAGIIGDYGGGNPAKVEFHDGTETYRFWDDQSLSQWAIVKARRFDVVDEATSRSVNITPKATISASYGLQLPPATPAAGNSLLALNNAGDMALAESAAITNQPTINGGVKHDNHTVWYPPGHFFNSTNGGSFTQDGTTGKFTDANVFGRHFFFQVPLNRRLTAFAARFLQSAGSTVTILLNRIDDGVVTNIPVAGNTSVLVGSAQTVTATVNTPAASTAGRIYRASVTFSGGGVGTYDIYALAPIYDYA